MNIDISYTFHIPTTVIISGRLCFINISQCCPSSFLWHLLYINDDHLSSYFLLYPLNRQSVLYIIAKVHLTRNKFVDFSVLLLHTVEVRMPIRLFTHLNFSCVHIVSGNAHILNISWTPHAFYPLALVLASFLLGILFLWFFPDFLPFII